jgi:FkbM family methyltransferase
MREFSMTFQLLLMRLNKLAHALRSPRLLRALLSSRVLASAEHRRVLIDNFSTVVDIGANKGQFTLAVRRWASKARVIAFEPLSEAAAVFRNVFEGDSKVTLHQVAIGSRAGEAAIHVSKADDSSSLLPIASLQTELFPGTVEIGTETIKVGRLSEFLSAKDITSPALLKLDVQGYELEALQGCSDLIPCFDTILVECSFMELYEGQAFAHNIIQFLDEHGFALRNVYNLDYNRAGEAIQGDFVFTRQFGGGSPLRETPA